LQRQLKEDLDRQVLEKQRRKFDEWQAEAMTVYGPGVTLDDTARKQQSRRIHESLQSTWQQQTSYTAAKKAEEDAYYKPYEENWNTIQDNMSRMRNDDMESIVRKQQSSWLEAWKDHQAVEGARRKAAVEERARQEAQNIAPHIANYSDRILLAEQMRREQQEKYRAELQYQVVEKSRRHYGERVSEHQEEMMSGSYPFRSM
jgi:hypothetical protein